MALAQDVQFDYHRSANFSACKTYRWVDYWPADLGEQLLDGDIKRAVDEQLAGKGLTRLESGGDLLVSYKTAISQEKEYDYSFLPANSALFRQTTWRPGALASRICQFRWSTTCTDQI